MHGGSCPIAPYFAPIFVLVVPVLRHFPKSHDTAEHVSLADDTIAIKLPEILFIMLCERSWFQLAFMGGFVSRAFAPRDASCFASSQDRVCAFQTRNQNCHYL